MPKEKNFVSADLLTFEKREQSKTIASNDMKKSMRQENTPSLDNSRSSNNRKRARSRSRNASIANQSTSSRRSFAGRKKSVYDNTRPARSASVASISMASTWGKGKKNTDLIDHERKMPLKDKISLGPIEKYTIYNRFPYKMVLHILLLILMSVIVSVSVQNS